MPERGVDEPIFVPPVYNTRTHYSKLAESPLPLFVASSCFRTRSTEMSPSTHAGRTPRDNRGCSRRVRNRDRVHIGKTLHSSRQVLHNYIVDTPRASGPQTMLHIGRRVKRTARPRRGYRGFPCLAFLSLLIHSEFLSRLPAKVVHRTSSGPIHCL